MPPIFASLRRVAHVRPITNDRTRRAIIKKLFKFFFDLRRVPKTFIDYFTGNGNRCSTSFRIAPTRSIYRTLYTVIRVPRHVVVGVGSRWAANHRFNVAGNFAVFGVHYAVGYRYISVGIYLFDD